MFLIMSATRSLKPSATRRVLVEDVPYAIRERQNISRQIRRSRLKNFVGTVMLIALIACGVFAMSALRLSGDPSYVKPW